MWQDDAVGPRWPSHPVRYRDVLPSTDTHRPRQRGRRRAVFRLLGRLILLEPDPRYMLKMFDGASSFNQSLHAPWYVVEQSESDEESESE